MSEEWDFWLTTFKYNYASNQKVFLCSFNYLKVKNHFLGLLAFNGQYYLLFKEFAAVGWIWGPGLENFLRTTYIINLIQFF